LPEASTVAVRFVPPTVTVKPIGTVAAVSPGLEIALLNLLASGFTVPAIVAPESDGAVNDPRHPTTARNS
jgi:hypothetical protein